MSLVPTTLAAQLGELAARLDQLERAARMPALTVAGEAVPADVHVGLEMSWTPIAGGPALPVNVPPSGRLLVICEAQVNPGTDKLPGTAAVTSWRLSGPGGATVTPSIDRSCIHIYGGAVRTITSYVHAGLTPGPWTIRTEVTNDIWNGGVLEGAIWTHRNLVAVPL